METHWGSVNTSVDTNDKLSHSTDGNEGAKHLQNNIVSNTVEKVKDGVEKVRDGIDAVSEDGVQANESGEGSLTKQIESWTSKVPSATFLGLALGSIGLSATLRLFGRKDDAQFIGQWVPTILVLGLYNKLVKLQGSE